MKLKWCRGADGNRCKTPRSVKMRFDRAESAARTTQSARFSFGKSLLDLQIYLGSYGEKNVLN